MFTITVSQDKHQDERKLLKLKDNLSTRINRDKLTRSEFSPYRSWNESFSCYIGDLKIQLKLFMNENPQGSHYSKGEPK